MPVVTTYSFTNVTPEFGVNSTTTGSQTAPALTRNSNGDVVYAFQSDEPVATNQNVLGRLLSPTGVSSGSDFSVQITAGDQETAPRLATLSNGNVVVVYSDTSASGAAGGTSTAFRIFDGSGTTGSFPVIFENESDDQTAPVVAAVGTGFVIAHLDQFSGSTTSNSLSVQRYNVDGTTNGGQINVLDSANGSPIRSVAIAALTDGGFVVVWTADVTAGAGENYDVFAQRYTSAGVVNGPQIIVNAETDNQSNPTVVGLPGGGFAVAWEDEETGSVADGNIDYVTVNGSGVVGSVLTITAAGRQERPSIAALLGDVFVITYASNQNGTQDIRANAANASSGSIATAIIDGSAGAQTQPSVIALSNGLFTTTWTDSTGDGSGTRISAQVDRLVRTSIGDGESETITGDDLRDIVDAGNGSDTIDGAGGDDLLQGGLSSDTINGGTGNDVIYSMTQADPNGSGVGDILNGGTGDDAIYGSGGGDTITGGDGNDVIDGGGGNDTIEGGLNFDTINGGEGNDTIYANTAAALNGSGVGDTINGGLGNDTLTGSGGDDLLSGDDGDDVITGGVGADTLTGGIGIDILYGGTENDTFVFTAASQSPVGAADLLGDFQSGVDHINVTAAGGRAAIEMTDGQATQIFYGLSGGSYQGRVASVNAVQGADVITAAGGVDIFGSAAGQFLIGGSGADTLVGRGGADTLAGGGGVDTFFYTAASESTAASFDQILDFQGGVDKLHLFFADQGQVAMKYESGFVNVYFGNDGAGNYSGVTRVYGDIRAADILTSSATINVFGSTGNDVLISGNGADFIFGDTGNDTLVGQAGADRLLGGAGSDTFFYGAASDTGFSARDQILDFTSGQDKINVFFADAGQVAIRYVSGHTEVYFGNDGTGNFAGMVEVYGNPVLASDIQSSDSSIFVFPSPAPLEPVVKTGFVDAPLTLPGGFDDQPFTSATAEAGTDSLSFVASSDMYSAQFLDPFSSDIGFIHGAWSKDKAWIDHWA